MENGKYEQIKRTQKGSKKEFEELEKLRNKFATEAKKAAQNDCKWAMECIKTKTEIDNILNNFILTE